MAGRQNGPRRGPEVQAWLEARVAFAQRPGRGLTAAQLVGISRGRAKGIVDVGPCWDLSRTRHDVHGTVQGLYSNTPRTYDKKTLNWALGQAFLKAYIGIPYIGACFEASERVILDPRFLI